MKKSSQKSIVILGVVLGVVYMGYRVIESRDHMDSLTEQATENNMPSVAIVQATSLPAKETIQLPGTIQAWFQAPIYAQVSGYVKMWHKDWGARVKKGDILAEINAPALDAQYRQAKADLASEVALNDLAILTADRWIALRKNQAVSEQAISVKVAEAKAQQAKVNAAMQNVRNFEALIGFKTIVAPYDGVVINRAINVGDFINKEGTIATPQGEVRNLFTVADITRLRLFVSVPERYGVRAWMFGIMHNHFIDRLRAQRSRPEDSAGDDVPEIPQRPAQADALEVRDLDRLLQLLPPEHREVLLLVGVEELSYQEVAVAVGVPIGTVMSRLSRARARLREEMQGRESSATAASRIQRVK